LAAGFSPQCQKRGPGGRGVESTIPCQPTL